MRRAGLRVEPAGLEIGISEQDLSDRQRVRPEGIRQFTVGTALEREGIRFARFSGSCP